MDLLFPCSGILVIHWMYNNGVRRPQFRLQSRKTQESQILRKTTETVCVCVCVCHGELPQTCGRVSLRRVNYIDLDLHSRSHQNHENHKCLIISESIQAMPIKSTVKIVRLKVYMTIASPLP